MDANQQYTLGNNVNIKKYQDFQEMEKNALFFNGPGTINYDDIALRNQYDIKDDKQIEDKLNSLVGELFVTGVGVKLRPLNQKYILFYLAESEASNPTSEEKDQINAAINVFKAREAKLKETDIGGVLITVTGHSDGDNAEKRSQAMAAAVAKQLINGGVPEQNMIVYGEGNKHPGVPGVPIPFPKRVDIELEYVRGFWARWAL